MSKKTEQKLRSTHNIDVADEQVTRRVRELMDKQAEIGREIKDILTEHKNAYGTPKGAVRSAASTLGMAKDQYQAKREIEEHAKHIIKLFSDKGGQYSFLNPDSASEEEAA